MIRYAAAPLPPRSLTPASCRRNAIRKLAETFRELDGAGLAATGEVLAPLGFSEALLKRIGPPAAALARRLSVREVGR